MDITSGFPESESESESSTEGRNTLLPSHLRPWIRPIHLREDGSFRPDSPTFEMGTTAMAFVFDEGIVVIQLSSHMLVAISAGRGFQFSPKDLVIEYAVGKLGTMGNRSAAEVSKELGEFVSHRYPKAGSSSIGILVAAWHAQGCGLYRINGNGVVVKGDILATGSGSSYQTVLKDERRTCFSLDEACILLSNRRKHEKGCCMSVNEAAGLAKKAISFASYMAPHSGDWGTVYHVGTHGCKLLHQGNIEEWQKDVIKFKLWKYKIIGKGWSD
ncbi:OLC1v1014373C1 [Oldenlandia corymbosa var. corymbosa]|uniref:OLC1v1014373C1 n=1 Tax=Oldenlandia corymbosa var. corymbosa TaxID=529605 RepID=A0AAV1E0Q1_OLDCO|nr:OLC1v1014373C1 [Oldenlandia corymbosa var. corymbosa]